MEISAEQVKTLREKTGVGLMDCKEALKVSDGDMDKAVDYLREKGLANGETDGEGRHRRDHIGVHPHGRQDRAMVEVNCETDFVAKTDQFQAFVKDVAMQVTAANPPTSKGGCPRRS